MLCQPIFVEVSTQIRRSRHYKAGLLHLAAINFLSEDSLLQSTFWAGLCVVGEVVGVAVDVHVDVHGDGVADLLRDLTEETGGAGE
jgi:hypothetical protein